MYYSGLSRYLNQVHKVEMPPNQQWHCNLIMYISITCQYSSTYFIIFMTFERFYSIIRPHKASSFNTVKRAKITIVCIILCSGVCNSPHLVFTLSTGRMCFPAGKSLSLNAGIVYYWLRLLISFLTPFFSLLTMNCFIIHTLQRRALFFNSKGQGQGQCQGQSGSYKSKTKNADKHIYVMLLSVTFTFLVLFSPVYIFSLTLNVTGYSPKTPYSVAASFLTLEIAEKFAYTNYGVNFFLYVISGPKFRNDLVALFKITKRDVSKVVNTKTTSCSITNE